MGAEQRSCHSCHAPVYEIDVRCPKCDVSLSSTGAQRLIGQVILEHYEVTDILGQGGMSVVYKGKHNLTGQEVALKVLPPELAAHRDVKGRFLEEGRALAQLDHPNIVHLYNFGDDGDCLVLAMQFIRGRTWERLIMDEGKLSWERSAQLGVDVSCALDYAHGRGVVHRDMKPSNVLIRDLDGVATVMDFGIAKMQSSSKLTATGQTMGTVRYMSPEQVRGQKVDQRTDIYSLAITMYESLVGRTPYDGNTHFDIMLKHLNERPLPPSTLGVEIPPDLETVLLQAMSKNPEERQPTVKLFKEQLEAVLRGERPKFDLPIGEAPTQGALATVTSAAEASPEGIHSKNRRRRTWTVAAATLVVVAAASTYVLNRRQEPSGNAVAIEAPVAASVPPANAPPANDPMMAPQEPYFLPGLEYAVDEEFAEDRLRVLIVGESELSPTKIRDLVVSAREKYTALRNTHGWPTTETIPLPINLFFVPQSVLCNPRLYRDGTPKRCDTLPAHYRPLEHSLFLVKPAPGALEEMLVTEIAISSCMHEKAQDCMEVVQSQLAETYR